jgi:hypothetical protein
MELGAVQIASAAVSALAPFTPFLLETGKAGVTKLTEVVAEQGGQAAWTTAQAVWDRIKEVFADDPEVMSAANLVSSRPEDEARQKTLAEVLATRLEANPALADQLLGLLGGRGAVQRVVAERGGWVEDVTQRMKGKGAGEQTVIARDQGVARRIAQHQEK